LDLKSAGVGQAYLPSLLYLFDLSVVEVIRREIQCLWPGLATFTLLIIRRLLDLMFWNWMPVPQRFLTQEKRSSRCIAVFGLKKCW